MTLISRNFKYKLTPATSTTKHNRRWLNEYGQEYKGRLIVLGNGILLGAFDTVEEARQYFLTFKGLFITRCL